MGISASDLRAHLVSILRSQITIALAATSRAFSTTDGGPDLHQLGFARRTYERAVSLRHRLDLDPGVEIEIDADLDRLCAAMDRPYST